MASHPISIDRLTPHERVELIGKLWDSLDALEAAPITEALAVELDRREAEADASPHAGDTWASIKSDLQKKL